VRLRQRERFEHVSLTAGERDQRGHVVDAMRIRGARQHHRVSRPVTQPPGCLDTVGPGATKERRLVHDQVARTQFGQRVLLLREQLGGQQRDDRTVGAVPGAQQSRHVGGGLRCGDGRGREEPRQLT
jgi:hypothetical protein